MTIMHIILSTAAGLGVLLMALGGYIASRRAFSKALAWVATEVDFLNDIRGLDVRYRGKSITGQQLVKLLQYKEIPDSDDRASP